VEEINRVFSHRNTRFFSFKLCSITALEEEQHLKKFACWPTNYSAMLQQETTG
jgi:hypothetical protein